MQKLKMLLPVLILVALLGLLGRELIIPPSKDLPSPLVGEALPQFTLPELFHPLVFFSEKDLKGKVALLTVFASWCYACAIEQPFLTRIIKEYHVPIYGINYKDDPNEARAWLKKYGNPFLLIGNDSNGDAAMDLGVYGTPETFIINRQGRIIYRHIGVINEDIWSQKLWPLIQQAQS